MTDGPSAFWDDLNRDLEDPAVRTDFEQNQAMLQGLQYTVSAHGPNGEQLAVTLGPVEGAITYNEYLTGPSPWWKRIWRRLRAPRRRVNPMQETSRYQGRRPYPWR
jgi:hypothetical protein